MINLLPPSYKEELQREEQFRIFATIAIALICGLLSFALILLSIRIYARGVVSNETFQISSMKTISKEGEQIKEEIKNRNATLSGLTSFYDHNTSAYSLMKEIEATLPSDVALTSFSFSSSATKEKEVQWRIALAGIAPTRESIHVVQENLKKNPNFAKVSFPSTTWTGPATNVAFNVTFEAKPIR
ncbi:MAG: PilN domain-containing protein [Candidatus Wildermuthbacteria bacterium]|nr:PilN domain-containing protein [Candidatus Wildermuthbacteria bacterium]